MLDSVDSLVKRMKYKQEDVTCLWHSRQTDQENTAVFMQTLDRWISYIAIYGHVHFGISDVRSQQIDTDTGLYSPNLPF